MRCRPPERRDDANDVCIAKRRRLRWVQFFGKKYRRLIERDLLDPAARQMGKHLVPDVLHVCGPHAEVFIVERLILASHPLNAGEPCELSAGVLFRDEREHILPQVRVAQDCLVRDKDLQVVRRQDAFQAPQAFVYLGRNHLDGGVQPLDLSRYVSDRAPLNAGLTTAEMHCGRDCYPIRHIDREGCPRGCSCFRRTLTARWPRLPACLISEVGLREPLDRLDGGLRIPARGSHENLISGEHA